MTYFRPPAFALALLACGFTPHAAAPVFAQASAPDPVRDATHVRLTTLLATAGPKIGVTFRASTANPYNFIGTMTQGLHNSDSLEIVIAVSKVNTIDFYVYPHYKGGYINLAKVKDRADFAHRIMRYSYNNFLFWGVDDADDAFSGFTVTLESGFPDAAIDIVLRSISNTDKYVGEMRPAIDGTTAP